MFENNLQFGLLGYGKMGTIRHKTLSQMEQCDVKTVYDWQILPETRKYFRNPGNPKNVPRFTWRGLQPVKG